MTEFARSAPTSMPGAPYFGPRALSENGSAPLVAFGLALALDRRSRTRSVALGAALVGLSAFFRLQNLLFCAGLLTVLLARRNWRAARLAAGVMTSCAAAFGLLDLVTWGSPFHSAVTYVADVSSASNRAVSSVSPFDYYFRYSLSAFGPLLLVVVPLSLLGARRGAGLLFIAVVYLLVHSLAGHKEYRVMIPLMPVVCALAAVGLDVMYRGISSRAVMRTAVAVTVALATISALTYRHLTFGDLGAYLGTRPQLSAYDDSGSVNRLMLVAHDRHDLCGLKVESIRILWSGGYTYLSRSVPIYPATGPGDDSGQYNYVITTDPPAEGRTEVATDGGQSLDRLSTDGCRPGPID